MQTCDSTTQVQTELFLTKNLMNLNRDRRDSEELFISVVLDWQRIEHRSFDNLSSSFNLNYENDNDHEKKAIDKLITFKDISQKHIKRIEDPSPTSIIGVPERLDNSPILEPLDLSPSILGNTKRIGIYSPRARRLLLEKYYEKRKRRISRKTVRYGVRKTLANARPRVRGRFVKTTMPLTAATVKEMMMKNNSINLINNTNDSFHLKMEVTDTKDNTNVQ